MICSITIYHTVKTVCGRVDLLSVRILCRTIQILLEMVLDSIGNSADTVHVYAGCYYLQIGGSFVESPKLAAARRFLR